MSKLTAEPLTGVMVRPLEHFFDNRGTLHRMLRVTDSAFVRFGEVYFSGIHRGQVKGWKRHHRMTSNLAVPFGSVQFVLFDPRPDSPTFGRKIVIETGSDSYCLITIPPGIWTAWKGVADGLSLIANCATDPHDPAEVESADLVPGVVEHHWGSTS